MVITQQIAQEINASNTQVSAAVTLLDEGATVPFIARYRKEATGGLDDTQLRTLEQRLGYLRELEQRRDSILKTIQNQGHLTDKLKTAILAAENKTRLEDLYLPFKPKRRTKGQIAKEAGLAPLAEKLFIQRELIAADEAQQYFNPECSITTTEAALDGARSILVEQFAEDAELLGKLRSLVTKQAYLSSKVVKTRKNEAAKYQDYFSHSEPLMKAPSHRVLAMLRGRNDGLLRLHLDLTPHQDPKPITSPAQQLIAEHYRIAPQQKWLLSVVETCWKQKLCSQIETELLMQVREKAEQESISVFAKNLKDLLMAAPAGAHTTLGLDPGIRTGVKVAAVDATGKLLHTATIFPHAPQNAWDKSLRTLEQLCRQFKVSLISIGNGTGSRETDKLVSELIKQAPELKLKKLIVSEAGASVYSASELAANEFPEQDVSLRGAISIARRLQDPLAELVKIDPKAIGVGQYQHDVNQTLLASQLESVVEDCVNAVGVDLNSASAALLTRVSGLSKTLAQNIIDYREQHGRFTNRQQLLKVPRLGPKAFELCAGFLRILNGDEPLDASAVHPESYAIAAKMLASVHSSTSDVIAKPELLKPLDPNQFVTTRFGLPTITDLLNELVKPGRDPRPEFKTANFKEGINSVSDLKPGMTLEGVVSNVANFGAFVDIGVHQDGLVHISSLSNGFVDDPHKIVKTGDIVTVKVMDVDATRSRISLSMRLDDTPETKPEVRRSVPNSNKRSEKAKPAHKGNKLPGNSALADAFAKAGIKK